MHGAVRPQSFWNLPEAAPALSQLPCGHARGPLTPLGRMTMTYTYIRLIHPGERAESEISAPGKQRTARFIPAGNCWPTVAPDVQMRPPKMRIQISNEHNRQEIPSYPHFIVCRQASIHPVSNGFPAFCCTYLNLLGRSSPEGRRSLLASSKQTAKIETRGEWQAKSIKKNVPRQSQ